MIYDTESISLITIFDQLIPWLTTRETVKLSCCSLKLFTLLQNATSFWEHVDFSGNALPSCTVPFKALCRSSLSKNGMLITGLTFSFSEDFKDSLLLYLPPDNDNHTGRYLEHLNFNGCKGLTNLGLKYMSERWTHLKVLELYCNTRITDEFLATMISSNGTHLETLNLSGCKHIGDKSLTAIGLSCKNTLMSLDLTRTSHITSIGLTFVCNSLHHIERLILYACHHLSSESFISISKCLHLKELDLCGCPVLDTHIQLIAKHCSQLEILNLTWCIGLTDLALQYLATYLANDCPKSSLKKLSLHGIRTLTPLGIESLANSKHSLTLQAFDVRGCDSLQQEYLQNHYEGLRQRFPNVTIFQLHS